MKALAVFLVLVIIVLIIAYNVNETVRNDPQRYPNLSQLAGIETTFEVEYRVTSRNTRLRSVYYLNETGGHEALHDVRMPFTYSFTGETGEFYSVSADSDSGQVQCELLINGVVQETQSAGGSGSSGSVRCDGRYRLP